MFGEYKKMIPIKLYTDSKPLLESIGTHQVEEWQLRNNITDMKEVLSGGEGQSFSWLDGETSMIADALTKENRMQELQKDIVLRNRFEFVFNEDNMVRCVLGEIRMENKCDKIQNNKIKTPTGKYHVVHIQIHVHASSNSSALSKRNTCTLAYVGVLV